MHSIVLLNVSHGGHGTEVFEPRVLRPLRVRSIPNFPYIERRVEPLFLLLHSNQAIRYQSSMHHSTGVCPIRFSSRLMVVNGLLPKNPRLAESGDGCADLCT